MFKPQRINELLDSRRITKVEFCEKVNISTVTLNRTTEHGAEIGCIKLERIADFFQVPIDYFFDRENYSNVTKDNVLLTQKTVDKSNNNNTINGNGHNISLTYGDQQLEIQHLKELLAEKERMIQLLLYNQNIKLPESK